MLLSNNSSGANDQQAAYNRYAVTIYVLNSALVKLASVTVLEKVYCGLSLQADLGPEFWSKDSFGGLWGSAPTLISAERDREAVMRRMLSRPENHRGAVI